uniref:Uncharacterized protein n=1 Tax=Eptatretus burgeri TaxID=7764 RepID=A0A8C4R1T7_EPTBU
MALRRKGRSPAFFSHEFFIQNHVDMMSVLIACFLLAFMFEVRSGREFLHFHLFVNFFFPTNSFLCHFLPLNSML